MRSYNGTYKVAASMNVAFTVEIHKRLRIARYVLR